MKATFLLVTTLAMALVECGVIQPPPSSSPASHAFGKTNLTVQPYRPYGVPSGLPNDISTYRYYHFKYRVRDPRSGTDHGHEEIRLGAVVEGRYFVLLPNGSYQIVEYVADKNHYRPTVFYIDYPIDDYLNIGHHS